MLRRRVAREFLRAHVGARHVCQRGRRSGAGGGVAKWVAHGRAGMSSSRPVQLASLNA